MTSTTGNIVQPVSIARHGFTPEQVAEFRHGWQWQDLLKTGDISLYMFLHLAEFYPTAVVHRSGPTAALERAPDATIGAVQLASPQNIRLDQYLASPGSRAQGMIVVHRGKIVFEQYPGMREDDSHITMSIAKTMPGLVIDLLAEEGKIDVQQAVGFYVPALTNTAWNDIKVIDVLNMAAGLDIEENEKTRDDAHAAFSRFLRAVLNVPGPGGQVERHNDVIRSAKKLREPGQLYEYSSIDTQVLVLLAEAVENRCWVDIFRDRVWAKMNADGDVQICVTPDGIAMAFGLVAMRLRDVARFGMLYTPSWNRAARESVVTPRMIENIRKAMPPGRKPGLPEGGAPIYSSRQWEWVFDDGDIYKGGLHGQGLYVSPDKDLVIAWFSTAPSTELLKYARAIAAFYEV